MNCTYLWVILYIRICVFVSVYTFIFIYIYIYIHMHIYIYIQTLTHTHTRIYIYYIYIYIYNFRCKYRYQRAVDERQYINIPCLDHDNFSFSLLPESLVLAESSEALLFLFAVRQPWWMTWQVRRSRRTAAICHHGSLAVLAISLAINSRLSASPKVWAERRPLQWPCLKI